jgi:hypothetical protein
MNLYSIHCGFYDEEVSAGIYEFHVNIPVVAKDLDEAKARARLSPVFQKKKMHIDGIQEIKVVDGFLIELAKDASDQKMMIEQHLHRDL